MDQKRKRHYFSSGLAHSRISIVPPYEDYQSHLLHFLLTPGLGKLWHAVGTSIGSSKGPGFVGRIHWLAAKSGGQLG
jgi:hypothetical protein